MKKLILKSLVLSAVALSANAQGTDEPFFNLRKFYTGANYGSARTQAMGGAFTALGGDLSSNYINPAGLGFYNRSEVSGTLNLANNNNTATYIGNSQKYSQTPLELGQLGVVISNPGYGSRHKRGSFGISYTTLNSFSNRYSFSGSNQSHSISDSFAELANAYRKSPQEIKEDYEYYGRTAGNGYEMALMGGLIYHENGNYVVADTALPITQRGDVQETGNLGQLNLSYGANFDDKTYFGVSLGIQTLRFNRYTVFDEAYPSNSEWISNLYYETDLNMIGTGVNLKAGVIHRLNDYVNLGATIQSPTWMKINDSFQEFGEVTAKNNERVMYYTSARTAVDELNYSTTSPFKFNLGVSAYLPNKVGVVSAEMEYLNYKGMHVKDKSNINWSNSQDNLIKGEYKNVVNFKAGLELRSGIARFRAGVNVFNDPAQILQDYNAKKSYTVGSLGVGIRNSKFFADLSYSTFKSTDFYNPYSLDDKSHYSVSNSQKRNIIGLSIGTFF